MIVRLAPLVLVLAAPFAPAQDYPSRPIRLVVPYAAGGPVDIMARFTGQRFTEQLGVQVVVDNRPGANGNIGGEIVARAVPDGHTLFVGANGPIAVNPSLYSRMPYDPLKDLAPVGQVAASALIMVTHPSVPAASVGEFIALAKAKAGGLNYASSGSGSTSHLCTELLRTMTGIALTHIPYKGAGPALTDLVGGQVQMMITGVSSTLPFLKASKLRGLGVTSEKRVPALPDVPAIGETVRGYEVVTWYGIFAPNGTPKPIVDRLYGAIVGAMGSADARERMAALGAEPAVLAPDRFAPMIRTELGKWSRVVKAAGMKPE